MSLIITNCNAYNFVIHPFLIIWEAVDNYSKLGRKYRIKRIMGNRSFSEHIDFCDVLDLIHIIMISASNLYTLNRYNIDRSISYHRCYYFIFWISIWFFLHLKTTKWVLIYHHIKRFTARKDAYDVEVNSERRSNILQVIIRVRCWSLILLEREKGGDNVNTLDSKTYFHHC